MATLEDKLLRALNRQGPQHPEARRVVSEHTTRDMHPEKGSAAILRMAAAGVTPRAVSSLNTGDGGKKFAFGIPGFGWGEGTLEL